MQCAGCKSQGEWELVDSLTSKLFCTNECYFHYEEATRCVPKFNLASQFRKGKYKSVFFSDENVELATMSLAVGESLGRDEDAKLPTRHQDGTESIMVFNSTARVTIFSDDKTYSFELTTSREKDNITVIPPNTFHLIENIGDTKLLMLVIYTPPSSSSLEKEREKK